MWGVWGVGGVWEVWGVSEGWEVWEVWGDRERSDNGAQKEHFFISN
ncbi:MAG: hypothetical protein F6K24_28800 [Okeania sp. SIO2D1]|nr:hypothetical protein [Okeania sp. SIO2D1]